jgi:glucose/arabinose dehydrogenase
MAACLAMAACPLVAQDTATRTPDPPQDSDSDAGDGVTALPRHLLIAAMRAERAPRIRVRTLTDALTAPWGMAFLPDGRLLVTQRSGALRILDSDGQLLADDVTGLPDVDSDGQGGLLDVAVAPDFADDPWIYFSFTEPSSGAQAGLAGTAVARGRLVGSTLTDMSVIFRQIPKSGGSGHFGSRLAFTPAGKLFVTLGDRRQTAQVQDLATTVGKTVRINPDGSVPGDNPMPDAAEPAVWSYGHRNPQGAAVHPTTGELWLSEHGPQGGDEINRVVPGGNHGWPLVSYGCNYGDTVGSDCAIGGGTHSPDYIEPVATWVPTSTAPAGMLFYTGTRFPRWQGNLFVAALAGRVLWRLTLEGDEEIGREALLGHLGERIRDVEQDADGELYLLTDSGKLLRIEKA